ncbi:MAG: DEAD/DEAH box helicase [Deltaproteobacteria bacterium]|nr:DEAD/DEAH box helicase [Deltaproteobacteria bacterium]
MFGKVIDFQKKASESSRRSELPSEITTQFNSEVLNQGLRLAEASRITHINFGRESYFAIVSDGYDKLFNVHIMLDPDSKVLSKASCGCFRSSTRTYCQHIVSLVRYVLRPDPETGLLRSLGDDFQDSFWNEISWFGFKNFGDSTLGFKAQVNHGGEGIRITFCDRNKHEILAFMPGERLVEEFLHEFYDIIRRDIDGTVFRRMYGRKLKDPNVPSLRRRPWRYSDEELEINRKGLKSLRQHVEDSMWHTIAKVGFLVSGREGGVFNFRFLEFKEELIVEAVDETETPILRFIPPRSMIGAVISRAEKKGVIGNDLLINPRPLQTGYKIELKDSSELAVIPVVENPNEDVELEEQFLDRTELERQLFGSYYLFPDLGFYKISSAPPGLPQEYFSPQKRIIIEPENIGNFLNSCGTVLRSEPAIIVDECLLNRETLTRYNTLAVKHEAISDNDVTVKIEYEYEDFAVSLSEILEAKSQNRRYVVRGSKWIDIQRPEFAWLDGLEKHEANPDHLNLSRSEYLRFLALNERVEKKYASARIRELATNLEALKPPTRVPSISAMKGKLRSYQKNGYGWLWFLYQNKFSGLLCDDMGLGKTHQIMGLMTGIINKFQGKLENLSFLVVCPTTVLSHWYDKVMEYAPLLDPYIYHGTDRLFENAFKDHRTIITSYGIALRDREMLAEYQFELMVLDEAQSIKNKSTKTYAAIRSLNAKCIVGLTGTPIENSVTELKSLFDITLPGYLLTDSSFENHFRIPIEEFSNREAKERLSKLIRPFTLRRKKEQVLTELPPKIEDIRRCNLSESQTKFYKDIVENQGLDLVQQLKDPGQKVPYMHIFAVLNYLKQICNHPILLEKKSTDYTKYSSGKWDLFIELLDESLRSGQKVVVFSQYVKMLEVIEAYLRDIGVLFATIKGNTRKRAEEVRRFNTSPDCMVFSGSLRASGLGIDLTGASVVIHYDRWWNAAREEQATDRVHRIGQIRGVQVFKLLTRNTLEEKIDGIISKKKRLMETVVKQDDKSILKHFSREDLIELISF